MSLFHALGALALTVSAVSASTQPAQTLELAVRTADTQLEAALEDSPIRRWVLPQRHDLRLEVSADADGQVLVETCQLPAPEALARQLDGLPAALHTDGFELGGVRYGDDELAFALLLPERSTEGSATEKRRWIACGADAEKTAGVVNLILMQETGVRFWRQLDTFDYLVFEHSYSQRSGHWQEGADGRVALDPNERDDLRSRTETYESMWPIERQHVTLRAPAAAKGDARAPALADQLDEMASTLGARLGHDLPGKVEALIENDHIEQGRHTGAIDPAVLFRGRLHLVYHPDDVDFYRVEMARLLIRRANIELPPLFEDGAAVWLAGRWYGKSFGDWMPALTFGRVLPNAEEISARERPGDASRVLFAPAIAWALDQLPGQTLKAKLKARSPQHTVQQLADRLAGRAKDKTAKKPAGHTATDGTHLPFQRGVSFAMSNGLEIGYHAPGVDQQLQRLSAMGTDAVSIMPFAYQPRPDAAELSFLNRSPSSETDVGAIHAARRADEHDFFVLWKPHIWLSYDSWPGDIAMRSEAAWQDWFRSYRRYILHHAVLAQFAGAELFSIGVELGQTVEREAEWRHLIASVRGIYDGPLTYAGNWWADYDRVPFWDALDIVGIDAYFPLAGQDDATDAQLRDGARKIVKRLAADAERYKKAILLTEVGFAARRGAWISPHEEGGEVSDEHQERAWAALLDELGRPDWLRGLYAWKVFSHQRAERGARPDFRFLERPARAQLERYFLEPVPTAR